LKNKILIIDDEKEMCWALEKSLQKDGLEVFTATDGTEGLKFFLNQKIDLVLLDIKIREISGLVILEQIRARDTETPVLVMTGYSTMDMALEAMGKGATGYLTKPLKMSNLRETVKKLLSPDRNEKVIDAPWNSLHD